MEHTEQFEDPFQDFPPEIKEHVDGLVYLGHLDTQFEFCGHTFNIQTLKVGEELLASQIAKEYMDGLGAQRAWMSAQVALALVSIDFDEEFCPPVGPDPKAFARARFNYVIQNWYPPTVEYIFGRYAELLQKQVLAIDAIANLSERSPQLFTPSGDFLTDKGTSPKETGGESPTQAT